MIGQNKLTVKLNITPFEYIKFDRPTSFSRKMLAMKLSQVLLASAALLEHTILLDHVLGLRTSFLRQGEVTYSFSFGNFMR